MMTAKLRIIYNYRGTALVGKALAEVFSQTLPNGVIGQPWMTRRQCVKNAREVFGGEAEFRYP